MTPLYFGSKEGYCFNYQSRNHSEILSAYSWGELIIELRYTLGSWYKDLLVNLPVNTNRI